MRLRLDDDLMFRIDGGDTRVALDDAFVGRHLRALVVRAIAFAQAAGGAVPIRRMRREPLTQLLGILCEARGPRRGLGGDIGLKLRRIGLPVPLQHRRGGGLHLLGPLRELGPCAAPMLGRIARQLHPINREHLPPDQPLSVTHCEHRRKHVGNVVAERAHEVRDGGEMRRGHATQRHERHVLLGTRARSPGCARCLGSRRTAPP